MHPTHPEPSQVIRRPISPPRPAAEHAVPPRRPPAPTPRRPAMPSGPSPRLVSPKPRRTRGRHRWVRVAARSLLIGAFLLGTGMVGGAVWLDAALHREPILTDYSGRPGPGRGTNWLLVGSDSRQGLTTQQQRDLATGGDVGAGRTDTILLVHLPRLGSSTAPTMVSIPRDSYVPIPGHGTDKINAAFAMGGASLLTRTVEGATGLRLDHYAEVGFSGFAVLVDALGGITVCPAEPIRDPLAGIDLPAGCQRLGGRAALGYVRTRATPRADLDRMINQRLALTALLHRATRPVVWLSPWRWYSVPRAAAEALTVDRGDRGWDLARLGWALRDTIPITVPIGQFISGDAGSVVVWDHDGARGLFDALAADAPVPAALAGQS
nr:LCP family protein [Mycobacterium shinjukuense]